MIKSWNKLTHATHLYHVVVFSCKRFSNASHLINWTWWTWYKKPNKYFRKIKKFLNVKINEWSFSNPHPWAHIYNNAQLFINKGWCIEINYINSMLDHYNGLVQDCSNSSALAMELLQSCTKQSTKIWHWLFFKAVIHFHSIRDYILCIVNKHLVLTKIPMTLIFFTK